MHSVFKMDIRPSSMKFLLLALADNADARGICWPSVEELCRKTSQNRKTVMAGLAQLEENGIIVDTGKREGRTGKVKIYKLTLQDDAKSTVNGTIKSLENTPDNSTGNGTIETVPETAQLNDTGNGTIKQSRFYPEMVPFLPGNGTENGNPPTPPYIAEPSRNHHEPNTRRRVRNENYSENFEVFWKAFPNNGASKVEAWRCYQRAVADGATEEGIQKGAAAYASHIAKTQMLVAHATTWLNQKRWTVHYGVLSKQKPESAKEPVDEQKMQAFYRSIGKQHPKYNPEGVTVRN